jgi:hypothetical protein
LRPGDGVIVSFSFLFNYGPVYIIPPRSREWGMLLGGIIYIGPFSLKKKRL